VVLAAKTLHFDFSLPWRRLAATAHCSNWRREWVQVGTFYRIIS